MKQLPDLPSIDDDDADLNPANQDRDLQTNVGNSRSRKKGGFKMKRQSKLLHLWLHRLEVIL